MSRVRHLFCLRNLPSGAAAAASFLVPSDAGLGIQAFASGRSAAAKEDTDLLDICLEAGGSADAFAQAGHLRPQMPLQR